MCGGVAEAESEGLMEVNLGTHGGVRRLQGDLWGEGEVLKLRVAWECRG